MAGLTKAEIVAQLRKRNLKVTGSKADLQKRLADSTLSSGDQEASSAADIEEDAAAASSTPARRDNNTVPAAGQALPALLPTFKISPVTEECLKLLDAPITQAVHLASDMDADLQPLKVLAASVVTRSAAIKTTSSWATNFRDLKECVGDDLEHREVSIEGAKIEVASLLATFSESSSFLPAGPAMPSTTQTQLFREVSIIARAICRFGVRWTNTFPEKQIATPLEDFSEQEKEDSTQFTFRSTHRLPSQSFDNNDATTMAPVRKNVKRGLGSVPEAGPLSKRAKTGIERFFADRAKVDLKVWQGNFRSSTSLGQSYIVRTHGVTQGVEVVLSGFLFHGSVAGTPKLSELDGIHYAIITHQGRRLFFMPSGIIAKSSKKKIQIQSALSREPLTPSSARHPRLAAKDPFPHR